MASFADYPPDDLLTEGLEIGRLLLRNWWVFALCTLASVGIGVAVQEATPDRFDASALVTFEGFSTQQATSGQTEADTAFLETQVAILRSDKVLRRVLDLAPFEIPPEALDLNLVAIMVGRTRDFVSRLLGDARDESEAERGDRLRRLLLGATSTERVGQSRMLEISAGTTDPELSAKLVNHIAATYFCVISDAQVEAARQSRAAVEQQLAALDAEIESLEERLEAQRSLVSDQKGVIELRRLETSLRSTRAVYESSYADFLRLSEEVAFPKIGARLVGEATPPVRRNWPRASVVLGVAVALGFAAAFLGIVVVDRARRLRRAAASG